MARNYYFPDPRKKVDCFVCSVANALLEIGDNETADLAYKSAANCNYLKSDGGLFFLLANLALKDLTNNKYAGRLIWYMPSKEHSNLSIRLLQQFGPQETPRIIEQLKKEKESGLLQVIDTPCNIRLFPPSLLFLGRPNGRHIVVLSQDATKKDIIIDDGQVHPFNDLRSFLAAKRWRISGALTDIKLIP